MFILSGGCAAWMAVSQWLYAWKRSPISARTREDQRLPGLVRHSWLVSGGIYGYRKVRADLRELGEACGKHRVARLMRRESLRSQTGYYRCPKHHGGRPAVVAPNHLDRQFIVAEPNKVWVTDITYIRTREGWLDLAAVLDLFSRQVIGWSMGPRIDRELALRFTDGGLAKTAPAGSPGSFRPGKPVQQS